MGDIYTIETARTLDSEEANSTIQAGEPAVRGSGGVDPLDVVNDGNVDALVVHQRASDANLEYEFEYQSYSDLYTYEPAGNKPDEEYDDRVPLLPLTKKDHVRFRSIEDTSEPEPAFDENDEVGFIDLGNGPRVVQAGYTDGAGTQYGNGGAGDYLAIGRVDKQSPHEAKETDYDELIPVRVTENI